MNFIFEKKWLMHISITLVLIFVGYCAYSHNINKPKQIVYHNFKNKQELKREIDSDRNYYDAICNDCINHREKIEQNIKEGGDATWWHYMCSDFCKNYIINKN